MKLFNGMFGKVDSGMCRLSINGNIAVKTSNGFKSYNVKTGRLTNCDQFVFEVGEEFFFIIPTNKVEKGDIILVENKPKCVIGIEDNKIIVINYETSTEEKIIPEHHVFMGNTYFYGKIVSMFGTDFLKGKNGPEKIMKFMMLREMMNGSKMNDSLNVNSGGMNSLLPLMLMNGNGNLFEGIFDLDIDEGDTEDEIDLVV